MAERTAFQPSVSFVNYDVTSSDDDLSEIESANVYASRQLPASRLPPEFLGPCSQSDSATQSDSGEDVETAPDITEPAASSSLPLAASIPLEKPQERLDQSLRAACRSFESSISEEESQSAAPSAKRIKTEVVEFSSSSSESCRQQEETLRFKNGRIARRNARFPVRQPLFSHQSALTGAFDSGSGDFDLRKSRGKTAM